jgi:hypothetical protein
MAGFLFRLETADGAPADPPTFATAVPNWSLGDVIPLGHRALRVIGKRDDDADQPRCWSLRTPEEPATTPPPTRCRKTAAACKVEVAGRLPPSCWGRKPPIRLSPVRAPSRPASL